MRGPLSVRIGDGTTDRHVTRDASGLRFTKTAPGGHAFASVALNLPRSTFTDLGPADRAWIYDSRTGRTVFEGFVDKPGATDGPAGQSFDLSILGSSILASDESRALIYVNKQLDGWMRSGSSANSASVGQFAVGVVPGLLMQFNPGQPIDTLSRAKMADPTLASAGMGLGGISLFTYGGKSDTAYRPEFFTDAVGVTVGNAGGLNTTGESNVLWVGTDFPATSNEYVLQLRRVGGATNVADDLTYAYFSQISVIGQRMDRLGVLLTGSAGLGSTTQVLAHQVVEDLLGRLLTMCDKVTSQVSAGSYPIDQLAYSDGATARRVLDDLTLYEPDLLWEILADTGAGFQFNYRPWPTTPRYEIGTRDGFSAPGSDVDLCNRIAVYWTDVQGSKQTIVVTAPEPIPALGSRIRDADPVTLSSGRGSESNAVRLGLAVLAEKASPPKSGRATVTRPIHDRLTGNLVLPHEIEPGYLALVRETGDVLRVTQVEYVDDDAAATLVLGEPTLTVDQRVARLARGS